MVHLVNQTPLVSMVKYTDDQQFSPIDPFSQWYPISFIGKRYWWTNSLVRRITKQVQPWIVYFDDVGSDTILTNIDELQANIL